MRAFIWKMENPAGWPALESGAALARFTCAPLTRRQPFRCTVARISSRNGAQQMLTVSVRETPEVAQATSLRARTRNSQSPLHSRLVVQDFSQGQNLQDQ